MGIIKDERVKSLNPSDYSEESQVQLSLAVDRNDYVIAGWRERKGSGSNKYLQYVTGVFPGCWCTLESSSKACWTIYFPDGGHPKDAMRAMFQKRNPDHSTWKDYALTMLFASGDKASLTELHQTLMDTLPLSDTVQDKIGAKRKRKAKKIFSATSDIENVSTSAIDTDHGKWKEERRRFKIRDVEKRRLEREKVENDRARKQKAEEQIDSGDAGDNESDSEAGPMIETYPMEPPTAVSPGVVGQVLRCDQASDVPSDDDDESEECHVPSDDDDESEECHVPSDDDDESEESHVPSDDDDETEESHVPSDDADESEESHVPSDDDDESEESHVPSDDNGCHEIDITDHDNDDHDPGSKADNSNNEDVSGSESEMEIVTEPSPKPPKRPRLHVRRRLMTTHADDALHPVRIIMDEDTASVINSIEVAPGASHAILASREVSPRVYYV